MEEQMEEGNNKPDDLRLSESEWRNRRKEELRSQEMDKLIAKVVDLETDNRKLRDKATPEGALLLSKADAERWARYQTFGKPDDLEGRLQTAESAVSELSTLKRKSTLREVADLSGYKPSVLERLGSALEFEVHEQEVEGKKTKGAFVRSGESLIPVSEYAQSEWSDFMPSLQDTPVQQNTPPKVVFPSQKAIGEAPKASFDYIKQRKLDSGEYSP